MVYFISIGIVCLLVFKMKLDGLKEKERRLDLEISEIEVLKKELRKTIDRLELYEWRKENQTEAERIDDFFKIK